MSARTARAALTALAAVFLIAADAAESPLQQYQRLRGEAGAAARAGDLVKAETLLTEALRLYPDVPGSYIRLARVQVAVGKTDAALVNVETYARMGLRLDVTRDPALKGLADLPAFREIAVLFEKNGTPFGDATEIASLPGDPQFIGEGVVHDGKGWLLSTVSGRSIVRVEGGATRPFLKADAETGAIFGMAVDRKRGVLWAAEARGAEVPGGSGESKTGLLKISLKDGRILARFFLPSDSGKHQFGDVVLAEDGSAYATDSVGGGLWRLKAGSVMLEPVVAAGVFASPQGMAFCAGGKAMLVADYSTGLHRVDLATGETALVGGLRTGRDGRSRRGARGRLRDAQRLASAARRHRDPERRRAAAGDAAADQSRLRRGRRGRADRGQSARDGRPFPRDGSRRTRDLRWPLALGAAWTGRRDDRPRSRPHSALRGKPAEGAIERPFRY